MITASAAGRAEGQQSPAAPGAEAVPPKEETPTGSEVEKPAGLLASGRKLVESFIIAVVTSTGVYLIGSVYTETYYGRMSIDALALDLPPPYIALQAVHALQSLLAYPAALLLVYLLMRVTASRLPRAWAWLRQRVERLGRVAILVLNVLVILPLIIGADAAGSNRALIQTTSALSEVVSLIQVVAFALLVYVLWLSLGPRKFLLAELEQRRVAPMALVIAVFLLGALVNTADRARLNAERLMTGASDTSLAITFTMADNRPLPGDQLILVAMRNSHYFVVERQPDPPSRTPRAFAVPYRSVDAVAFERINAAAPADPGIVISLDGLGGSAP
jgi:hypothetical protein